MKAARKETSKKKERKKKDKKRRQRRNKCTERDERPLTIQPSSKPSAQPCGGGNEKETAEASLRFAALRAPSRQRTSKQEQGKEEGECDEKRCTEGSERPLNIEPSIKPSIQQYEREEKTQWPRSASVTREQASPNKERKTTPKKEETKGKQKPQKGPNDL